MADFPPSALDPRQQQFVENAQTALRQGHFDYVLTLGASLLEAAPDCVALRRVMWLAQQQRHRARNSTWGRVLGTMAVMKLRMSGGRRSPGELFAQAEKILSHDPVNVAALKLQAQAAAGLGWLDTVVFLREAAQELAPGDRGNALALGEAWLTLGRSDEALRVAEGMLRVRPIDGEAQALLRKASVAQVMTKGNWEGAGDFREKLRKD